MSDLLTAPTNIAAEWSVLGHMLQTSAVIGEVIGVPLEQQDFSQADTRQVYATIIERHYSGQSIDPLIIGEAIRDELAQLWNADAGHIGALLERRAREGVVRGNALEHAAIVKALSTKRKLMDACTDTLSAINDGKLTPEEVGDQLSSRALQATVGTQRRSELLTWMDTGREGLRELQRVRQAKRDGIEIGVYTGLAFIDDYTTGIGPGELCFLVGEPGAGKALALDTPIATRGGWTTMGEIMVGETVFDSNGWPTRVVAVSDVQLDRECYRVTFDDGQSIVADATHRWVTTTRTERQRGESGSAKTTQHVRDTMRRVDGGFNHRVAVAGALQLDGGRMWVEPWTLGYWLGNGRTNAGIVTIGGSVGEGGADYDEVVEFLRAAGYEVRDKAGDGAPQVSVVGLGDHLANLGVLHCKHIPAEYKRADVGQRAELLAGIVDSDGYVDARGRVEVCVVGNDRLAEDICELVASLGMKFTCKQSRAMLDGRFAGWRWRISFVSSGPVARLARKRRGSPTRDMHHGRFIRAVTNVPSVPVRCIAVDSPMHTYLAGRAMIPTHNTAVAWAAALGFGGRQLTRSDDKRVATLMVSMEMNNYASTMRVVQNLTGIDGVRLREGDITDREYKAILREWKNREHLPILWNFASNFRTSQLRALVAEGIRQHNVGFVVIDHFRMLDSDRRYQNGLDADEAKVRFLKENIAKDLNVAVLCLAHTVKLSGEGGAVRRPKLSDLRGSGMISAFADQVGFLWRPYEYMSDEARMEMDARPTDVELLWEKNRFGARAKAELTFIAETMRVLPRSGV